MTEVDWDPEIDTPATVAVVGGGPIGVEAALYARFLGYFVMLFDSAKVGDSVLCWGDAPMPGTWGQVTSSLGLAALEAQGSVEELPSTEDVCTYRQYVEQYLLPIARTDLLYESVQIHSAVRSISRLGCARDTRIPIERRAEQEFRLLIESRKRGEYSQLADIVLDCTGVSSAHGGMATGTGISIGQRQFGDQYSTGKVDGLGKSRDVYSGKHSLLFGSNWPACANALEFARLASETSGTRLTWVIPKQIGGSGLNLSLPDGAPAELLEQAYTLCGGDNVAIVPIAAWGIESLTRGESGWNVKLQVGEEETLDIACDEVINCAPCGADWSFLDGLSANSISGEVAAGSEGLPSPLTSEPHYYVLGQKGFGAQRICSIADGLSQIQTAFGFIGGRSDLNLYETVKPCGQ